jgi:hypothetical protein
MVLLGILMLVALSVVRVFGSVRGVELFLCSVSGMIGVSTSILMDVCAFLGFLTTGSKEKE